MTTDQLPALFVGDALWGALEGLDWLAQDVDVKVTPGNERVTCTTGHYRHFRSGRTLILTAISPYVLTRAYVTSDDGSRELRTADDVWTEVTAWERHKHPREAYSPEFESGDIAYYGQVDRFVWVRSRRFVSGIGWSYHCTDPDGSRSYYLGGVLTKCEDTPEYRAAVAEQSRVFAAAKAQIAAAEREEARNER